MRVKGKLIRRSLKTRAFSAAKLRPVDLEKLELSGAHAETTRLHLLYGDGVIEHRKA
jgi:hypothetical protein